MRAMTSLLALGLGRVLEDAEDDELRGSDRRDPDFAVKDAMSRKYVGTPFPWRYPDGVILVIEIDRCRYQQIPLRHAPAP